MIFWTALKRHSVGTPLLKTGNHPGTSKITSSQSRQRGWPSNHSKADCVDYNATSKQGSSLLGTSSTLKTLSGRSPKCWYWWKINRIIFCEKKSILLGFARSLFYPRAEYVLGKIDIYLHIFCQCRDYCAAKVNHKTDNLASGNWPSLLSWLPALEDLPRKASSSKPICWPSDGGTLLSRLSAAMTTNVNCTSWRHDMETFSALLNLCGEKPPVLVDFPSHRASNAVLW